MYYGAAQQLHASHGLEPRAMGSELCQFARGSLPTDAAEPLPSDAEILLRSTSRPSRWSPRCGPTIEPLLLGTHVHQRRRSRKGHRVPGLVEAGGGNPLQRAPVGCFPLVKVLL